MAGGPPQQYALGPGGPGLGGQLPPQQLQQQPAQGYAPQAAPQQAQQMLPPWAQQPQQQQQGAHMNGAYDPAAVQPGGQQGLPPQQAQQAQQQAYDGYLPSQPAPQQAQQGLPPSVDLHQLGGLLQSLSGPGNSGMPQPLGAAQPGAASPRGGGGGGGAALSSSAGPPPRHFGLEQLEWGVRVDEFHGLSPFARYVHPAAALKLQQLWDAGNRLVSLLDDA
jgi:hypothetical protein